MEQTAVPTGSKKMQYIFFFLLIVAVGVIVFLYKKNIALQSPAAVAQAEILAEYNKVSKLMLLPTNDQLTLIKVTDPSKLAGQSFFANAKVGDELLIFPISQKAVLYSPSQNRILEVSSINLSQSATEVTPTKKR